MNKSGSLNGTTSRYCHSCRSSRCFNRNCSDKFSKEEQRWIVNMRNGRPSYKGKDHYKYTVYAGRKARQAMNTKTIYSDDEYVGLKKKKKTPSLHSIDCPICLTVKGNCRSLGCGHSVCIDCLSNILECETLENNCPLCRTSMFPGGTSHFNSGKFAIRLYG